jgi:glycine/D-amino acid oxidase-like deaminating enzyme
VVGQGLAGSLLSYHLIRKGKKVVVYDDADQPKASMAAAGIFNPFTGRKLVKTWMADELFTFLQDFYINLEADLNIKIMSKMPMYRPFLSVLEQNEWGGKYLDSGYRRYIDSIISPQDQLAEVVNPLGGMMLRQCGFVNIRELIKHIRSFLIEKDSLKLHRFSIQDLQLAKSNVMYDGMQASRIIFCEGPWLSRNHYFNWLPMRPVKGELIEIELQQSLDFIVNRGVFVLPVGGRTC